MLFNPSREQVRRFFIDAWQKRLADTLRTPLEEMALNWITEHPEYWPVLEAPDAMHLEYPEGDMHANPFLHLSMHLAIEEQLSIDQPAGIKAVYARLNQTLDNPHAAAHTVMDCLGEIVWEAQQTKQMPDSAKYLERLRRAAG